MMELKDHETRRFKVHRRLSSVFVPPRRPILDRTSTAVASIVRPVSLRCGRRRTHSRERHVVPNYMMDPGVHRYELLNYQKYSDNKVKTTKYNFITFIPKNLWEQFHRIANLYFVTIAALNWVPALQAFNRFVGMIPVILILFLTALKDAYEDCRRRKLDKRVNQSYCHVWDRSKGRFRKMQWQHVIVGDLVHLSLDEIIPADILLMRSSSVDGLCFIETSNLDGESSLKQRRVPDSMVQFSGEQSSTTRPPNFRGSIRCEKPNNLVYQISGKINHENGLVEPIGRENMILRGCQLRNTTFIEGIVLYAGKDTKAMMNNSGPRYKRSSLEIATNRFILYCVIILVAMCLFAGIASTLWLLSFSPNTGAIIFIILNTSSPITDGILNLISAILNYQILIPLSLYISVELVKLGQIYLITQDIELYDHQSDYPMECRSLNIPEELGRVQYIMSDKTGTLTENLMLFRRCTINGVDYAGQPDPADSMTMQVDKVAVNGQLKHKLETEWSTNTDLLDFFMAMAICNTVVVCNKPRFDSIDQGFVENGLFTTGNSTFLYSLASGDGKPESTRNGQLSEIEEEKQSSDDLESNKEMNFTKLESGQSTPVQSGAISRRSSLGQRLYDLQNDLFQFPKRLLSMQIKRRRKEEKLKSMIVNALYEAESPDELALVHAARAYGITLITRSAHQITVALPRNVDKTFEILKVLPFDSTRKKMSVIVRDDEEIVLFCKGADSEIIAALSRRSVTTSSGAKVLQQSKAQLERYSTQGLRTLLLAKRILRFCEYERWLSNQLEIESLSNQEDGTRELKLQQSYASIESELQLLGVTAIEDRLQDGVEETIESMREAGIQVWLLTGDKMETAINIARSCALFPVDINVFVLSTEDDIQFAYSESEELQERQFCLVISTTVLPLFEKKHKVLLTVIQRSLAVLFYRLTPSNKAEIVKMAKKALKGKVLAIGDGANDVSMIQCADIGIGISGQEGMQAVMAADFAIARFRFLKPLLLVHGHWCYDRLVRTFLFFLYKNALFVFVVFWYQIYNGFSGTAPMDPIYTMTYPIIFTGVQPLVFGISDQIAPRDCLINNPSLYGACRSGKLYRAYHFWLNILDALWQSAVIYFVATITYWDTNTSYRTFGFLLATSIFLVNSTHLAIEIHCWTVPVLCVFVFFTLVHFAYFWLEDLFASANLGFNDAPVNVTLEAIKSMDFWAAIFLSVTASILPRLFICIVLNTVNPSNVFKVSAETKQQEPRV